LAFPVYSRKCKSQVTKIIRYRDHMKIFGHMQSSVTAEHVLEKTG